MGRKTPIKRIVIFGDSLSDIGNMQARQVGRFATINAWGRFSDGRNWVDYLWESASASTLFDYADPTATTTRSKQCRSLLTTSACRTPRGMELVNYAEGGATAGSTRAGIDSLPDRVTRKVVISLKTQVATYFQELDAASPAQRRVYNAETLHIVWIGANDIVTVEREPAALDQVAKEVAMIAHSLTEKLPRAHVVVLNLPDLQFMPKYKNLDPGRIKKYAHATAEFNRSLEEAFSIWSAKNVDLDSQFFGAFQRIKFLDIARFLTPSNLRTLGFAPLAQGPKTLPRSTISRQEVLEAAVLDYQDLDLDAAEYIAVKDLNHPTEGVYREIARAIQAFLEQHYTWP